MSFENFSDPVERINTSFNTPLQADCTLHGSRVKIKEGVVKSVKSLNYDTFELVIEVQDNDDMVAKAGQYAIIKLSSLDHPRAFSFARAPITEAPGQHTFFIRLVPDGKFSNWLSKGEDCVGEKVVLSGPMGQFGRD